MKLGTLLFGGIALGGLITAGIYTWRPTATPGFEETAQLARARQDVVDRPDDVDAWLRLGDEARHVGDTTTARLAFERVAHLRPDDPRGHTRLGVLLVDQGDDAAARIHLERAADLGSDDARFVLAGLEHPLEPVAGDHAQVAH